MNFKISRGWLLLLVSKTIIVITPNADEAEAGSDGDLVLADAGKASDFRIGDAHMGDEVVIDGFENIYFARLEEVDTWRWNSRWPGRESRGSD